MALLVLNVGNIPETEDFRNVADERVVRIPTKRVGHVLERIALGLAERDGRLASGRLVAELRDVAPAGLFHECLSRVEMAILQRPGLITVLEYVGVSHPHVAAPFDLSGSHIGFADGTRGKCSWGNRHDERQSLLLGIG